MSLIGTLLTVSPAAASTPAPPSASAEAEGSKLNAWVTSPTTGQGSSGGDQGSGSDASGEIVEESGQESPKVREIWLPYCLDDAGSSLDQTCIEATRSLCGEEERLFLRYVFPPGSGERVTTNTRRCLSAQEQDRADVAEQASQPIILTNREFRSLPLAGSQINFQDEVEGWGVALVGHHVNVWADSEAQTLTTTILGTEVEVRATPIEYRWSYGDGRTRTVAEAGSPRPDDADPYEFSTPTSVVYEETGNYDIGLETVYTGQFRYNGSPWLPVSGVAVVPSDPRGASIWETVTRNVAEDCVDNPDGWACRSPWLTTPPWEK
ncbi:hypothetical protein GCM10022377_16860 [Zhihengliuella alba]|uniref:PKD domain-containing protein n=1 Tax=Zhihengliuella alba TaxID=547018 RepID=A0ABP7DFS4_9MICC